MFNSHVPVYVPSSWASENTQFANCPSPWGGYQRSAPDAFVQPPRFVLCSQRFVWPHGSLGKRFRIFQISDRIIQTFKHIQTHFLRKAQRKMRENPPLSASPSHPCLWHSKADSEQRELSDAVKRDQHVIHLFCISSPRHSWGANKLISHIPELP